jgi:hypothetical protein
MVELHPAIQLFPSFHMGQYMRMVGAWLYGWHEHCHDETTTGWLEMRIEWLW